MPAAICAENKTLALANRSECLWLDDQTGLPIKARSGVLRWFTRSGDELHWADSDAWFRASWFHIAFGKSSFPNPQTADRPSVQLAQVFRPVLDHLDLIWLTQ